MAGFFTKPPDMKSSIIVAKAFRELPHRNLYLRGIIAELYPIFYPKFRPKNMVLWHIQIPRKDKPPNQKRNIQKSISWSITLIKESKFGNTKHPEAREVMSRHPP